MKRRRSNGLLARRLPQLLAVAMALACREDPAGTEEPPVLPTAREVASRLPVLELQTAGGAPITSTEVYVTGSYRLSDTTSAVLSAGTMEIRGRGNTTWSMPKKPYRVKLGTSAALLGMPASRHWVLLANFSDKTLLRNEIAFEFSRALGMEYAPRSRFVEVQLNGSYDGIYQLTEHVRIAPERVNIPELKVADTTAVTISGGYLLEVDERSGEAFCLRSTMTRMVFCAKEPETLNDPAWARHRAYLVNYLQQVDQSILGPRFTDPLQGYQAWIDVESAINYYLLNELFKNVDGNLRLSTYLYKKRGGKLHFGPVWDFDLAIGNVNYLNADKTDGWYIRTAPWFDRLFQDPAFAARVLARWNQLTTDGTLTRLDDFIQARKAYLSRVQVRNFERWPILSTWVWPNRVVTGSYDGEVAAMSNWLWQRRLWMVGQLRP